MTPHVAQKAKGSAIDGRTTRHAGYAVSQRKRKLVEEAFGWGKTIAGMAKVKVRGLARVRYHFTFAMAAYNLIRMPRLLAEAPERRRSQRPNPSGPDPLGPSLEREYGPSQDPSSTAC